MHPYGIPLDFCHRCSLLSSMFYNVHGVIMLIGMHKLPTDVSDSVSRFVSAFESCGNLHLPRLLSPLLADTNSLHCFGDASPQMLCAVIYIRSQRWFRRRHVLLFQSWSSVLPSWRPNWYHGLLAFLMVSLKLSSIRI